MVGAAYLWVFIYSVAINPTGDQAFYEQYAQVASPVVAVVTAFPVFYWMGRSLRSRVERYTTVAAWIVVINLLMEIAVLAGLEETFSYVLPFSVAAGLLKVAGAYLAVRKSDEEAKPAFNE